MELKTREGGVIDVDLAQQRSRRLIEAAHEIVRVVNGRIDYPGPYGMDLLIGTAFRDMVEEADVQGTRESLVLSQVPLAYKAHRTILEALKGEDTNESTDAISQEAFTDELNKWLTRDKLFYTQSAMDKNPDERFTLVATPNVLANADDIDKLMKVVANNYGATVGTVNKERLNQYTARQLSGTGPEAQDNKVVFSLVHATLNSNRDAQDGQEQLQRLATLRAQNPGANLKIPSVLETLTYWQTLREGQAHSLLFGDLIGRTLVQHFDLPEVEVDDERLPAPEIRPRRPGRPRKTALVPEPARERVTPYSMIYSFAGLNCAIRDAEVDRRAYMWDAAIRLAVG